MNGNLGQEVSNSPGRKVISRASRGGFSGEGASLARIGKGEYQNMMRALNYDHNQDQSKISERTKTDRKKFE